MNNLNNSIVRNDNTINPAIREAILSGHEKFGETFTMLAEGAGDEDKSPSIGREKGR